MRGQQYATVVEARNKRTYDCSVRSGLGMVGMRERAAIVNGTIEFLRPREGGTLVRLRFH